LNDPTPVPGVEPAPAAPPDLGRISIVLIRTTEPGNIGATCRAMKTMGLGDLRLVDPLNPRGRTARSFAHAAQEILDEARVVDTLEEALDDVQIIAGTTARRRQLRKHALLCPGDLARKLVAHAATARVALLFGTERTGLTNDEMDVCRYLSTIDTATPQPSLNLAQAVQLYAWEIRQAWLESMAASGRRVPREMKHDEQRPREKYVGHPHRSTKLPTLHELDTMYAHLARAMRSVGYTDFELKKFLTYLRHLHQRAGIVDWELQIYHLLARRILEAQGAPRFDGTVETDRDV
jgi:TrmH family RNA methyltransferase